jgi:2-dehydro-3-deoxygluconokinase
MSPRVVTFGELMLRLSPPGVERFLQSALLSATFGGSEANVAVSLARFGLESAYVTALPAHAIGEAAVRALRAQGVHTDHIVRSGARVGIYFAETGAGQRASTVIYDRAHSAIAELSPDALDWASIVAGATWLHVSGITPALGASAAESTRRAMLAARDAGVRISFDLNYRRTLWSTAEAQRVIGPMVRNVDAIVANEEDLQSVLGISVAGTEVTAARLSHEGFRVAAERVTREFGPRLVAITLRESFSASENAWSALLWDADAGEMLASPRYDIPVVDRIGAGDSFVAGLIYALVTGRSRQDALRFAVAAGALKHTIPGDFNLTSVGEVERLMLGDGSGRVQR